MRLCGNCFGYQTGVTAKRAYKTLIAGKQTLQTMNLQVCNLV